VKGICSPRTMKQCRSGLHIWIRNYRRYSCTCIKGHSKNFSSPQAAKVARTPGSSIATASHSWDQSRSRQPTNIVHTTHLHNTKLSSVTHMDNQKHKKNTFYTHEPCLHGAVFFTHRRAHMRTCSPHRRTHMRTCSLHRHT
jgi:hypothetical protein